jgi:hypothetical protein
MANDDDIFNYKKNIDIKSFTLKKAKKLLKNADDNVIIQALLDTQCDKNYLTLTQHFIMAAKPDEIIKFKHFLKFDQIGKNVNGVMTLIKYQDLDVIRDIFETIGHNFDCFVRNKKSGATLFHRVFRHKQIAEISYFIEKFGEEIINYETNKGMTVIGNGLKFNANTDVILYLIDRFGLTLSVDNLLDIIDNKKFNNKQKKELLKEIINKKIESTLFITI